MQLLFGFIIVFSVILAMVAIALAALIGLIILVGAFVARFRSWRHRVS
jgi:hypothetical protein